MQTTMSHGRGAAEEMDKKHGENKAVETLFSAAQLLNVAMLSSSSRAEERDDDVRGTHTRSTSLNTRNKFPPASFFTSSPVHRRSESSSSANRLGYFETSSSPLGTLREMWEVVGGQN